MADENPVPNQARPDNGMAPTSAAPTAPDLAQMKSKEEARQQASRVIEMMEQKQKQEKAEKRVIPSGFYGENVRDLEAMGTPNYSVGVKKLRKQSSGGMYATPPITFVQPKPTFGEKLRGAFKAEVGRVKTGPRAYASVRELQRRPFESRKHQAGRAIGSGIKGLGEKTLKGLENTGQELIYPVEKSPIQSEWTSVPDKEGKYYRIDRYTITSKRPLNKRRTETYAARYQVAGPGSNEVLGTAEAWHIASVQEKRLDVNERKELFKNVQSVLNGEDLAGEIGYKKGPAALLGRDYKVNLGSMFGIGGTAPARSTTESIPVGTKKLQTVKFYPLSGNLRVVKTKSKRKQPSDETEEEEEAPEAPAGPTITKVRVPAAKFRGTPPIAAQSVAATMAATQRTVAPPVSITPQGYVPEYASAGMGYRSQVRRWVGTGMRPR